MKNFMNKHFPIRLKTIRQRQLHSPWLTTGSMKCFRKNHRWFRLFRNGLLTYNAYNIYEEKLRLLLIRAREHHYVKRLSFRKNDVKRNWKVLNSLLGKNKKLLQKEFIIDGVWTSDTTKIYNSFCNYFIDHPKKSVK